LVKKGRNRFNGFPGRPESKTVETVRNLSQSLRHPVETGCE
jgi:hypothetical protein